MPNRSSIWQKSSLPVHAVSRCEDPPPVEEAAAAEPLLVEGDAHDPRELVGDRGGAAHDPVGVGKVGVLAAVD